MSQPGAENNVSSGLPYFSDQPNRNASCLGLVTYVLCAQWRKHRENVSREGADWAGPAGFEVSAFCDPDQHPQNNTDWTPTASEGI